MPVRDYRAYAQSPNGKDARARAHQRYTEKRRKHEPSWSIDPKPLAMVLANWRNREPLSTDN